MTVGQYALISLACQVFTSVVLSGLLTTVSALWKASLPAYVAGAALLGLFLVPMYLPPKAEWLSGPLALATPLKYFASCYTANLFTLPIPWAAVQAALWSALSLGLALLAHRATHRKRGAV